jgi:hypothetical protein
MLRSPSLKQRPKPVVILRRSEESQIHFEPITQTGIRPEMFRYAQHDNWGGDE